MGHLLYVGGTTDDTMNAGCGAGARIVLPFKTSLEVDPFRIHVENSSPRFERRGRYLAPLTQNAQMPHGDLQARREQSEHYWRPCTKLHHPHCPARVPSATAVQQLTCFTSSSVTGVQVRTDFVHLVLRILQLLCWTPPHRTQPCPWMRTSGRTQQVRSKTP